MLAIDLCGTLHCSFVQLLSDVWAWMKCGGGDRFIKSNADVGGMHERESFFWFFSLIVCVLQTTQMHVVVRRDHVGVCVEILNLNWLLGMLCFEACSISGRNMAPWWTVGNKYIAGAGNPDAFTGVTSWQRWYVLGNPVRMYRRGRIYCLGRQADLRESGILVRRVFQSCSNQIWRMLYFSVFCLLWE